MAEPHLVFALSATLGAMGELAGHERRPSLDWPGRSAVLGLVAAALGIRRTEAERLRELDALGMAVAVFDDGTPLRDYHTVQTVPTAAVKRPDSRPQALRLAGRRVNTTLSQRDYRQDALFGVALWGAPLDPLHRALERPTFTLYLGRKACPLNAPLAPRIVDADTAEDALGAILLPPWQAGASAQLMVIDAQSEMTGRTEWRNDVALDRAVWHFAGREITIAPVDIRPEGGAA